MDFQISDRWLIPVEPGHSVTPGWPAETGGRPWGVTWHWTATLDLARCTRLLGGPEAERKGQASAHYGIGRSFEEGVHRYVTLENQSWHAGKEQRVRWDGAPFEGAADKGSRTTVGVETVHNGYARRGFPAGENWSLAWSPDGRQAMRVQPWTDEQIEMILGIGREILDRWPHIGPRDHHGHHDLCPGYKVDVSGFPFAQILRSLYNDSNLPDVWTPLWTVRGRQRALRALGHDLEGEERRGRWGPISARALRRFQRDAGLAVIDAWSTFVNWRVYEILRDGGLDLAEVAASD